MEQDKQLQMIAKQLHGVGLTLIAIERLLEKHNDIAEQKNHLISEFSTAFKRRFEVTDGLEI